jgi:hypothetical protein
MAARKTAAPKDPTSVREAYAALEQQGTAWHEALLQGIVKITEDHAIPSGMLWPLLVEIAVTLRIASYVASPGKPSSSGLKRELDRMLDDIEELILINKSAAAEIIADARKITLRENDEPRE